MIYITVSVIQRVSITCVCVCVYKVTLSAVCWLKEMDQRLTFLCSVWASEKARACVCV